MLKFIEWIKSSHGHIALLLLLVWVVSSCAKPGTQFASSFNPDDFIGRDLTYADVAKLRAFSSNPDSYVSSSSKLILGNYYLNNGDRAYAKFLINKNSLDSALTPKMKLYSKLWRLDLTLLENDMNSAGILATELLATPVNKENISVFDKYCREHNIELKLNESFKNCINIRLDKKETKRRVADARKKTKSENKINTTSLIPGTELDDLKSDAEQRNIDNQVFGGEIDSRYRSPNTTTKSDDNKASEPVKDLNSLETDGVINILDADISTDYVQGMIYAIEKIEAPYKINTTALGYNMGSEETGISIKPLSVVIGDKRVYFDINYDDIIGVIAKSKIIDSVEKIVISVPETRMDQAGYLKSILTEQGKSVTVFNTDGSNFQAKLREMYELDLEKTILNIAIGSDEEVLKFLPIIKYVQTDNSKHKILLGTNSITITNLTNEYRSYFKDIYIVTPSEQIRNKNMAKIALNYKNYFGKDITFNNMLGYDMLIYIDNLVNNKNLPYLTGIVKIDNGVVYRVNRLYYLDKLQNITEIN